MTQEELQQAESSAIQHHEDLHHQERMGIINEQAEYNLFALLKPKLTQDGNQWCVLYGDDLQVGIAGFGDSPLKAIMDFNSQWHKQIKPLL